MNTTLLKLPFIREEITYTGTLCLSTTTSPKTLLNKAPEFCSKKELDYIKESQSQQTKTSYLLGRLTAKKAIAKELNEKNLNAISIKKGVFNYPITRHENKPCNQVTITHTKNYAIALTYPEAHPCGIDIEVIRPKKTKGIQKHCTETERSFIESRKTPYNYTTLWTIKESLSKVLKTGLMTNLNIYETKNHQITDAYLLTEFTQFFQYKTYTFQTEQIALSLTLPKKTTISKNICEKIQTLLKILTKENYEAS